MMQKISGKLLLDVTSCLMRILINKFCPLPRWLIIIHFIFEFAKAIELLIDFTAESALKFVMYANEMFMIENY